jgi:hypothetical protein
MGVNLYLQTDHQYAANKFCPGVGIGRRWYLTGGGGHPKQYSVGMPHPDIRPCSDMKLKLDLHDIYNRGVDIERALNDIMRQAIEKKAPMVEIIPGKGSGQLKKRVLRFLDQKEIKALYHRVEKDSKNFGRLFVHFRHR